MAVQEQTPYIEYVANGSTTSFALGFDCESQNNLIVLVDDSEPYSGSWYLNNGTVVFHTAPKSNQKLVIKRETPLKRETNFQSYDNSFRPKPVNDDFDRIWWKLQELGVADWLLSKKLDKEVQDRIAADIYYYALVVKETDLKLDELKKYIDSQVAKSSQNYTDLKNYIDSLINGITGENFLPILDKFVYSENGRTQKLKNEESISVLDFHAVGDGTLHTVNELITASLYTTLEGIQKDYVDVTSLTDSLDWAATMRGLRYLISRGGGSLNFPNIGEAYVYNKPVEFPANTKNITLRSDNANLYMDGVRIGASDPESVHIQGFNHIRFNEITNNGISFARPKYCTVDVNRVTGAGNFLVLFFASDEYVYQCLGNFIRVKYADGLGVSKGGLGMACMYMSRIEGSVTGVTQGIGYAVNFKNNCVACSADVITTRNKFGLVLSNDTGEGLATGVNSSTFTVTSYQDQCGASVHRSQMNTINVNYTGSGLSTDKAVNVAAHCQDNVYNVKAYNGHTDGYIFSTRSDKQDINILDTDYTFGKVGLFEPNTHYCNVLLYSNYSHSGSGNTVANYFTIDPTCRSITLQQLADAPNIVHNYDRDTGVESWQMGRVTFPVIGSTRSNSALSYGSAGSFTFRTLDGDVFGYNATAKSLDSVDQTTSIGRTGRHYTGTYTQKVMYTNTLGDFYGSGSPEGVVSASIGSTYRRTDANGGGAFYRKASGTGNTGWVS